MIWAWHLRKNFRFEGTFQHVILPRANDLFVLADDHKLIRSRLSGGRGCLHFLKCSLARLKDVARRGVIS